MADEARRAVVEVAPNLHLVPARRTTCGEHAGMEKDFAKGMKALGDEVGAWKKGVEG
ncbi:MAG: hypothetical protein M1832_004921 [Thelocarpon impressellum]|nr:MAG: hypothetical protein M1832_004921 [Thelocarpon impressellum]